MPELKCKKCGGNMKPSKAIKNTYVSGVPDFPGADVNTVGQTVHAGGPGKLIDCEKCEDCGRCVFN